MRRFRKLVAVVLICSAAALSVGSGRGAGQLIGAVAQLAVAVIRLAVIIAVLTEEAEVRPAPESPEVLCRLPANTRVKIKARTPDRRWVKVEIPDGRTGWVSTKQLPIPKGKDVPVDKAAGVTAAKNWVRQVRLRARKG